MQFGEALREFCICNFCNKYNCFACAKKRVQFAIFTYAKFSGSAMFFAHIKHLILIVDFAYAVLLGAKPDFCTLKRVKDFAYWGKARIFCIINRINFLHIPAQGHKKAHVISLKKLHGRGGY